MALQLDHQKFGIYKALDSSRAEIRLLHIESGQLGDAIRCSLSLADLSSPLCPAYETISYCWGDTSLRSPVFLNGSRLHVPSSSARALLAFRLADVTRTVWIDAVCINQADAEEKGRQIALMSAVYRMGTRNLIFLGGPSDLDSPEDIIADIDSVLQDIRRETDDYQEMIRVLYDDQDAFRLSPTGMQAIFDERRLVAFFGLPWFRRVWVSQEAALSRNSVCRLAELTRPLTDVLKVAVWLAHKAHFLETNMSHQPGVLAAAEMFDNASHDLIPTADHPPSLLTLLVQHQDLCVHDPRDHIYGILGLYQGHRDTRTLPPRLRPDYNKSLAQVCTDATISALEEEADLKVFLHLFHRPMDEHEESDFPSWVPRWHRAWDKAIDASRLSYFFRADDGCHRSIEIVDSQTIKASGFIVNDIDALTNIVALEDLDCHRGLLTLIETAERVVSCSEREDDVGIETRHIRLGRLLSAGRNSEGGAANDDDASAYGCLAATARAGHFPTSLHNQQLQTSQSGETAFRASRFLNSVRRACTNRRMFVTSSGKLGLGPRTLQSQDLLCILFGSSWPVALRPHGRAHRVVGVCYVEGIMYGEAVLTRDQHKAFWLV